MQPVETRVRVRYAETDQMGVVYHANYIVWMEVGRVEFFRAHGLRYRDLEREGGVLLAVAEVQCRYRSPALYDDEVTIRTRMSEVNPRMLRLEYDLISVEDGRLLATGYTRHVFCGTDRKPRRLPEKYWAAMGIERATAPGSSP